MPEFRAALTQVRRALTRYRRVVAALLAAGAVVAVIDTVAPTPAPSRPVVVAAHDLAAGTRLSVSDLRTVAVPPGVVPDGASGTSARLVGRLIAGPMRAGEPVTDVRLLGRSLLSRYRQGLVAMPFRVGDASVAELLRVGDHIAVFAATSDRAPASLVVSDAPVMALPDSESSDQDGALIVIGVEVSDAAALAAASATAPLSVALLR
jgi:Flp pilus assembly protein CpaB